LQGSIGKIYVYDIDKQAMDSTKRHFASYQIEFISQEEIKEKITDCQLLVNATPIGMKEGDPSPLDKRLLRKNLYVYDIVYNRKTQFVKDAELLGANAVTGEGMLAWQGAIAFSCWIDKYKPADVIEVMRKELDKALKNKFSKKV
jgi:shikimate dehydrogenase